MVTPASRRFIAAVLLFGGLVYFIPPSSALDAAQLKDLLRQASHCEERGFWDKACDLYETALRIQRDAPGVRARYQDCLRRYWQNRRHGDLSYQKEVLSLDYGQALRLYGMVRDTLLDGSVDKKKLTPAKLFRKGMEELDAALSDNNFRRHHLPLASDEDIKVFRTMMAQNWGGAAPANRSQLVKQVREVALTAQNVLQLETTVTMMEFACGACYALDEYTLYLTPNQLRELCDSLKGENVGVGLELVAQGNKVLISAIAPFSPAAEQGVMASAQIVSIDKKPVVNLSAEAVRGLLDGPNGSTVDLELLAPGMIMPRQVTLTRRALFTPSISVHMETENIGYIRVNCFQDTTVREIDDALATLTKWQMEALILDLRGNSGGLFESAIEVARRFIANGIITSVQHQDPKFNVVYQSRNAAAYSMPLVVVVDGDTASAAEVLAGALKDNKRCRMVGQPTFGKGCTQCLLKLPHSTGGVPTGGLRLTVARFYSPEGQPYTGRGVQPHVLADRPVMPGVSMGIVNDQQMPAARLEAARMLELLR